MPERLLLLAALLLAACRSAAPVAGMPPNFGVVEDGRIYRGAQPSASDLQALHALGVRTILKLNGEHLGEESAVAASLGMKLIYVPLHSRTVGASRTCPAVERAYAALTDPAEWPVYVHCTHGRDRTGFLVGLFRIWQERWKWPAVNAELARYGHRGPMRIVLPNISRSLAAGVPACAAAN